MPSQYHSRKSTWRALLGGPGAQGCSTRQAEAPGAQPQPLPCPGDSWEHPKLWLWLSQAEKPGCVPGDKQQPLSHCWPSHALEVFPLLLEGRAAGPSWGNHSSSFLPRAVFLPCLWQFCPGAGGEILLSGFCSLLQPKQCVLCATCHPVVVPAASEHPKLMQTPTPLQRGARLPPPSLFLRFFLLENTLSLEHTSGCTCYPWAHLGHQHGAGEWPGWVCH